MTPRVARPLPLRISVALAAVALLVLATGCPEARPPVDQTQALPIAKTAFAGEWYFQRTVIDVPWETEFTFIGDQGELERIRWRIEEGLLVAVRSYERFEGSDPDRNESGDYEGQPVAAWPIESHFDIRREYNSTTGEETNVIVENDSDRPWYEREYIRVDWSQNVITNWNFYAPNVVELSPLSYAITDPSDPRAPVVAESYLEVTSAFFAQPITAVDPDWPEDGPMPLCWYFYHFDDCTAAEVVVRNSFLRVGDRDYEPGAWTGIDMELFGYFDVQRPIYDEQYGPTNTGRLRYLSRWNLWTNSHDGRSCTADTECSDVVGSLCDRATGQCTTPYRDRGLRDIVYYASPNLDERFHAVADEVVDQWNEAFRDTVNTLRRYECMDAGGSESDCAEEDAPDLEAITFCPNNPVQSGDPAVCGAVGLAPRIGDLRYSFLYNVVQPGLGNPFGFGPAQVDPLTGEIISASAFLYEAEVRSYAAWARDVVQLINGEISESDFIDGENVADWIEARNTRVSGAAAITEEEAHRRAAQVKLRHKAALPHLGTPDRSPAGKMEALQAARQVLRDAPPLSAAYGGARSRLESLIDSPVETLLLHDETLIGAAQHPGSSLTPSVVEAASPLRRVARQKMRRANRARMERNAERCAYFREFVDPSVEGYAHEFAGVDPEEIRWDLILGLYRGTMAHELGHTLGLRHNLEGSADPLNYGAEYWALRDDGSMGPRTTDPETTDEIEGRIREFQYSSVMDYLSRFNSDHLGARRYDKAAIKYGYGRVMEVFADPQVDGDIANIHYLYQILGWPGPILYGENDELVSLHYTEFDLYYGDLENRRDVPQRHLSDFYGNAEWFESPHSYMADAEGYPVVPYKFCSDEFAGSGLTCLYFDEGADLYEIPVDLGQQYESYYLFNNFGRDRMYFNADGYAWRIWDRYFDPMVSLNQWWVLFASDLYATEEEDDDVDGFLQRYDGFGPFTLGVRETFNTFARSLARPEPGGYGKQTDGVGVETWQPQWDGEALVLGIADGRYLSTDWDYDEGYFWDEAIHHVGYFTDKTLAMEALFDPTTYFMGQDTAADLRGYRVNYGSNFFEPLMELVGDLMVGEAAGFAPYEQDGQVLFPDYADYPFTLPADAVSIHPNADFTIQLHAMVMGLSLLPDTFDSRIIDSTRIWIVGDNAPATSLPTVSHTDPGSGLTWEAISYDETGEETGIAARMIVRANALAARLDDTTLDEAALAAATEDLRLHRENLNLLRAIHMELGSMDF